MLHTTSDWYNLTLTCRMMFLLFHMFVSLPTALAALPIHTQLSLSQIPLNVMRLANGLCSILGKRLVGKNVSEMTYFMSSGT